MKLEFLIFFPLTSKSHSDIVFTGTSAGEMSEPLSHNIKTEKRFLRTGVASYLSLSIAFLTLFKENKTFDYLIELNFSVQTKTFILFAKRIKIILAFSLYPLWSTILQLSINIFNSIVGLATLATFVQNFSSVLV